MKYLALFLTAMMTVGCASTRGAYQAAESPDEYAFVVSEHYNALLGEAADFVEKPDTSATAKTTVKTVTAATTPLVLQLRPLSGSYTEAKDAVAEAQAAEDPDAVKAAQARLAKAAADLQAQTTKAVVAVANVIRTLRSLKPTPTAGVIWTPESDYILRSAS